MNRSANFVAQRLLTVCNTMRMYSEIPQPPEDGACCGNGCQNCVWIKYWDDLQDYEFTKEKSVVKEANKEFEQQMKEKQVDPAMKAFLKMERKKKTKTK